MAELAAAAMDLRVALAEIDADNASAWDVQEHQLAQVEAFAAVEVAASQEVDALVAEAGLLRPVEQRAMDSALRLDLLDSELRAQLLAAAPLKAVVTALELPCLFYY